MSADRTPELLVIAIGNLDVGEVKFLGAGIGKKAGVLRLQLSKSQVQFTLARGVIEGEGDLVASTLLYPDFN